MIFGQHRVGQPYIPHQHSTTTTIKSLGHFHHPKKVFGAHLQALPVPTYNCRQTTPLIYFL